MCGNGVRCVARYLHEHDPALRRSPLRIETLAGVMSCEIATSPSGQVESIAVDMGAPRLGRADVPMLPAATGDADRRCIAEPLRVGGAELRVTALSMGNPHAVCFVEAGADLARMAKTLGPALERHPDFPRRTNAGFARLRDQRTLDLVVWERACGLTLACGTGACAAVVAAVLEERIPAGGKVRVHLPGGWLDIMVSADLGRVMLRGPAFEVFAGEVDLRGLLLRRASGPHD
jgi:diaminopimelate epimerase